jgi:hypothetical protein
MWMGAQSYLRKLHHKISGFDSVFGMEGSNNDINVLDLSPIFSWLVEGNAS